MSFVLLLSSFSLFSFFFFFSSLLFIPFIVFPISLKKIFFSKVASEKKPNFLTCTKTQLLSARKHCIYMWGCDTISRDRFRSGRAEIKCNRINLCWITAFRKFSLVEPVIAYVCVLALASWSEKVGKDMEAYTHDILLIPRSSRSRQCASIALLHLRMRIQFFFVTRLIMLVVSRQVG